MPPTSCIAVPDFDRMRMAELVQAHVGLEHRRRDPRAGWPRARRGAGAHDVGECVSARIVHVAVRSQRRNCVETWTCVGSNTMRGSGDHHRIGSPSRIPRERCRGDRRRAGAAATDRRRPRAGRPARRARAGWERSSSRAQDRNADHAGPCRFKQDGSWDAGSVMRRTAAYTAMRQQFLAIIAQGLRASRASASRTAARKRAIGDVVERMRHRRQESARELVLALRAGFEALRPWRRQYSMPW